MLPGLDKQLIGQDVGQHTFQIADVDGFGKKSAANMQLVPLKFFTKENIRPFPGLQVNIDDKVGQVRSVSGGRVIVDFNHPLASKNLEYDVNVHRIVTDKKEQLQALFKLFGFPIEDITIDGSKATIATKTQLPEQFATPFTKDLQRLTGLTTIEFSATPASPTADSPKIVKAPAEDVKIVEPETPKEELQPASDTPTAETPSNAPDSVDVEPVEGDGTETKLDAFIKEE